MKTNMMYRMALAADAATIAEFGTDLPDKYASITLGHSAFGVMAVAEEEGQYQTVGAGWAVVEEVGVQAFIRVLDAYDSDEVNQELREKLYEKAADRGIETLSF